MDESPRSDLLRFYSRYFKEGIVDLSSSSPPPQPLDARVEATVPPGELDYVPPAAPGDLREQIAARYRSVAPSEVLITAGASEALAAIALALVSPGDSVTHDRGTYPSFTEAACTAGARLMRSDEPAAGVTVAAVCHPTVPDGRLFDVAAWCAGAVAVGAIPVVDEVYRDLVHRAEVIPAAVDASDRAISVGGLSKPLGMGGLRIGWLATHDAGLLERLDRQLQLLSGGPASLSVSAASTAFECFDGAVQATLAAVRANAPRVYHVLDAASWTFSEPEAGLTVEAHAPFPTGADDDDRLFDAGYFLVPCDVYGTPGAYRVSLLADPAALAVALTILAERP